jgi:quinol-cytochrome oxidoreductase complex cytochrome b subunit
MSPGRESSNTGDTGKTIETSNPRDPARLDLTVPETRTVEVDQLEGRRGGFLRSIFRHGWSDTPQNRIVAVAANVWLHLHPRRVPPKTLRFSFTLCAGGIAFLLFLITVATGVLLLFYYRPTTLHAHSDVLALSREVPFGAFLRALHRYAGDGMILAVVVHLCRVLLTGSYKPPREFNWVVGVGLLVLTLAIAFTGYLLPYDQKGYWATTVGTHLAGAVPVLGADGPGALVGRETDLRAALLGGSSLGPASLVRFYALHCFVLPLLCGALTALHFWRVRKDGISTPL